MLLPLLADIYSIISSLRDREDEAKFYLISSRIDYLIPELLIDYLIPELLIDYLIDSLIDSFIMLDSAAMDYFIADS